jgi:hypothetical protein
MGTICVDEEIAVGPAIYPIENVACRSEQMLGVIGSRRDAQLVVAALVAGGFHASEIHLDVAPNPNADMKWTSVCAAVSRNGACLMTIDNATLARTQLAARLLARHDARTANFLGWLTETEFASSSTTAHSARAGARLSPSH